MRVPLPTLRAGGHGVQAVSKSAGHGSIPCWPAGELLQLGLVGVRERCRSRSSLTSRGVPCFPPRHLSTCTRAGKALHRAMGSSSNGKTLSSHDRNAGSIPADSTGAFVQREDTAMASRQHRFESGRLHRGCAAGCGLALQAGPEGSTPYISTALIARRSSSRLVCGRREFDSRSGL